MKSWSCGQSSPSTGDFVTFKLNHEMAWPINFKLLPLTLLTSPRLAPRSIGPEHFRRKKCLGRTFYLLWGQKQEKG